MNATHTERSPYDRRKSFDRRIPPGFEQIAETMSPDTWLCKYNAQLVTIKNGVIYYYVDDEAPLIAVIGPGIYRTQHYGLIDIEG